MEYLTLLAIGIVLAIFLAEPASDPYLDLQHQPHSDTDSKGGFS